MPKMKTKSAAKKRFSFTANGHVKAGVAGKRHGMIKRTTKFIRDASGTMVLCDADEKIVNISMTNLDELCEAAAEDGRIAQGDIARILKFRDDPSDENWISGGNE